MGTGDADTQRSSSSLVVPGNEPRQIAEAGHFDATQVVFDLADVDPSHKDVARAGLAEAPVANDYGEAVVAVRVNPWTRRGPTGTSSMSSSRRVSSRHHRRPAGRRTRRRRLRRHLVRMISERTDGGHRIGVEAEVDDAAGLTLADDIALASDRLQTPVVDLAGIGASLGADPTRDGPARTGADSSPARWNPVLLPVLVSARAAGLCALADPGAHELDKAWYRAHIEAARALGYDGAGCTHPMQVDIANDVFSRA